MESGIENFSQGRPDLSTQHEKPYDHDGIDNLTLSEDVGLESPEDETPGRYWTSLWLRKPTLLALIALFTALVASLVVLLIVERAHDGIRPTLSSNRYAWTYGPTAVLVVVLSLWRQVDYYCKLMQPWQEMHESPKDADNSLMLDYVSPILITSWIKAVRRRHIPVVASIAGFTIMKLIILFSTGLLVLTPTVLTRPQPLALTTSFTMDEFWKTVPDKGTVKADNQEIPTYSNISAESVYAYIRDIKDGDHGDNISLNNMVLQSFEIQGTPGLLRYTAEFDAFIPKMSCEIAQSTFQMSPPDDIMAVRFDSATCSVGAEHQTPLILGGTADFCDVDACPFFVTKFNLWRVNCSDVNASSSFTTIDINTSYDLRFALLMGNYTMETNYTDDGSPLASVFPPHEKAAVICKIDYSMEKATVLYNQKDGSIQVQHLVTTGHLNNLTGVMLGEIIHDALYASQNVSLSALSIDGPHTTMNLYYVLLRTLVGDQSIDRLLSAETLQSSACQVWSGIASHFVRESCIRITNVTSNATVTFVESRLHVGLVSVWAMISGFVLLIMLTICIMFTTYNDVVP
jgi:hypothetical protein